MSTGLAAYILLSMFVRSLILLERRVLRYVSRRLFWRISSFGRPLIEPISLVGSPPNFSLLIGAYPRLAIDELNEAFAF